MNKKQKIVKKVWGARIKNTSAYEQSYIDSKRVDARLIDLIRPRSKILDVGCFFPYEAIRLAKKGFDVTAIDISEDVIFKSKQLKETQRLSNLHFRVADATKLPFRDKSFDALVDLATSVLIPDWRKAIREYSRVLKNGGEVVIVTNNLMQPHALIELVRQKLNGGVHPKWGYFSPTYPWQLAKCLEKNGFKVKKFDSEVMWVPIVPFGIDKFLPRVINFFRKYFPFINLIGWRYGLYAVKVIGENAKS